MSITVKIRNVYGNELVYPACQVSERFAAIAGTKTLSDFVISQIKSMGYAVNVEAQTL